VIGRFDGAQMVGRNSMHRPHDSLGALSRSWLTLASGAAGFASQSSEEGAAHVEGPLGSGSVGGAPEAQSDYFRAPGVKAAGRAARIREVRLDLVKEAAKPSEDVVPAAKK